tara:strand:- start:1320 stop:2747 length:1428 start_codon:yes stop_codon:yes gene_type:complete
MNLIFYNILFFLSFIPIWTLKFPLAENLIILVSFLLIILILFHNFIYSHIKNNKNLFFIYLAVILTYGIDNNLSIFSDFIIPNASNFRPINTYVVGIIFLSTLFGINFLILKKLETKGAIIIFSFILSSLFYSFQFSDKSFSNFSDFRKETTKNEFDKITIIFIMDQMAGIESDASRTDLGRRFDKYAIKFSKKYNARVYKNIYTQCPMTYQSIPKLINFDYFNNCNELAKFRYIQKSNNFFNEYLILKNKLFDNFNSIAVFQNYHMNFCKHNNVKICDQYSQFKNYNYIKGFKDTNLSKIAGAWKHYGSITANIIWRTLLTLYLTDSYEQSGGEKGSFKSLLQKIEKEIITLNYDLIFVHSLSTHNPYGFDEKCEYSGEKYINYSDKNVLEAIKGQNNDRICILNFLDNFFEKLKKKEILEKVEFIILSDHGTRLSADDDSSLKTIFIHKDINKKYKEIKKKQFMQKTFYSIMK